MGDSTPPRQTVAVEFEDPVGAKPDPRRDSTHSSRLGSFIEDEPTFESQGSSDSESEVLPERPSKFPVSVVWQDLVVEESTGVFGGRRLALNGVSGYAVPRSVLAVVGPAGSGKSALANVIGARLTGGQRAFGSLAYNGKALQQSGVRPTFLCASDEPLANVTVEQALIYTALLQMPDRRGELEAEVRRVCERLGLLGYLQRTTTALDPGTLRRLTVACQLICCTPLLVAHDVLLGVREGDALAIMRALHQAAKEGCTAVVVCQQPTTDICGFFSSAYILAAGEVVYFGEAGGPAAELLASAGMPCPPLYSPVEQYMRLVDPSFEVYLQHGRGGGEPGDDWNARFSSMMFKVLQGAWQGSAQAGEQQGRAAALAQAAYDPVDDRRRRVGPLRQWFVLCRRLVTQGLQGLPLYLGRIVFSILLALAYGGTYWHLNRSFLAAQQRAAVLFLVAAVLPALAVGTLPFYANGTRVLLREHRSARLGVSTHFLALFTLTLPHLAAAAAFAAVALLPMVGLNQSGAGWGYFILNSTLGQLCADSMMLFLATVLPTLHLQTLAALALLLLQALASGYFPGANRGLNLPVSVVSFISWSYKGLLANEFLYRGERPYGCPAAASLPRLYQAGCELSARETFDALAESSGLKGDSRWIAIYVLLGIYGFWTLAYLAAVLARARSRSPRLPPAVRGPPASEQPTVVIDNPLHTAERPPGRPANGTPL